MSSDIGEVSLAQRALRIFLAPGNTKEVPAVVWQNTGLRQDICKNPLNSFSLPSCMNLSKRSKINSCKGTANQQSNIQRYFQESCQSYVHVSDPNNFKTFLAPKYSDINLLDYHSILFIPIPSATWSRNIHMMSSQILAVSLGPMNQNMRHQEPDLCLFSFFSLFFGLL